MFKVGETIKLKNGKYLEKIHIGRDFVGVLGTVAIVEQLSSKSGLYEDGVEYHVLVYECYGRHNNKTKAPSIKDKDCPGVLIFWTGSQGLERICDVQLEIF